MAAKLIIHSPDQQGRRRVRYDGVAIGVAHRPADVRAFLAAAGMENAEDVDLTDPDFAEWGRPRGVGTASLACLPVQVETSRGPPHPAGAERVIPR
ncbi:hypothetical protein ACWGA0_07460 [Streptomyces erythrochromogenes]